MTRINCTPPEWQDDQALLGEWHEMGRPYAIARPWTPREAAELGEGAPYRLGKGHVLWVYGRLSWLRSRQEEVHAEMLDREYSPSDLPPFVLRPDLPDLPFKATKSDLCVNLERLHTMANNGSRRTMRGHPLDPDHYARLIAWLDN